MKCDFVIAKDNKNLHEFVNYIKCVLWKNIHVTNICWVHQSLHITDRYDIAVKDKHIMADRM